MFANVNISIDFLTIKKKHSLLKRDGSCEGDLTVVKNVILQLIYND